MKRRVDNLKFNDMRSDELKEFMHLWNQVTLETESSTLNEKTKTQAKNIKLRVKDCTEAFVIKYSDPKDRDLKTSHADRRELWLCHLLNLY